MFFMLRKLQRSAFTLVELPAVIAVIACLAALLFPAFKSAIKQAQATACLAILHQIGIACARYLADRDGKTVFSGYGEELAPWPMVPPPYLGGGSRKTRCGYAHSTLLDKWPGNFAGFTTSVDYPQPMTQSARKIWPIQAACRPASLIL